MIEFVSQVKHFLKKFDRYFDYFRQLKTLRFNFI